MIDNSPVSYARHIAYLGCAHKVRNRTQAYFGRAPSLATCERFVRERQRERINHTPCKRACDDCGGPIDKHNVTGRCQECKNARSAALREAEEAAKARAILSQLTDVVPVPIGTVEKALAAAGEIFGVSRSVILSSSRKRVNTRARQAVMLVVCEVSNLSLPQIGRRLNRDHSTVVHGRDAARWRAEWDADYADQIEALRRAVKP